MGVVSHSFPYRYAPSSGPGGKKMVKYSIKIFARLRPTKKATGVSRTPGTAEVAIVVRNRYTRSAKKRTAHLISLTRCLALTQADLLTTRGRRIRLGNGPLSLLLL